MIENKNTEDKDLKQAIEKLKDFDFDNDEIWFIYANCLDSHIYLKVKDTEKTLQILKEQFEVDAIVKNNVITVETLTEKIPSIIKELAINDVEIKAVMPKEHTIEEIFFDATKGGKENE